MTIDAELKIYDELGNVSDGIVTVNVSYVGEEEDLISWVEEEVRRKYGKSLFYGRDFSIGNWDDLTDEMWKAA